MPGAATPALAMTLTFYPALPRCAHVWQAGLRPSNCPERPLFRIRRMPNCNLKHGIAYVLLTLLLLVCAFPTQAQERSWRISDFSADIEVHKDGSADINERISLVF